MMRYLEINAEAQQKAKAVTAYAREHIYDLAQNTTIPGDNPNFVCQLNSYRCVFTFTREKEPDRRLWRHLSVSVPSDNYPNPVAMAMIAGLFGFSDYEQGVELNLQRGTWLMNVNHHEHCIVLAEEVKGGDAHVSQTE